ncbi:hypothetical protein CSOJ01_01941 [Colletotrichum sojae]|uniref:Uncharacterized protein n=1 Tax=Colletotrichum sojae TaxID=2175907 RepID=A0A8H6N3P5_9PEZI|nr:hypothetical protein CSOJ01_01941 [Colletotrichum sojae]
MATPPDQANKTVQAKRVGSRAEEMKPTQLHSFIAPYNRDGYSTMQEASDPSTQPSEARKPLSAVIILGTRKGSWRVRLRDAACMPLPAQGKVGSR